MITLYNDHKSVSAQLHVRACMSVPMMSSIYRDSALKQYPTQDRGSLTLSARLALISTWTPTKPANSLWLSLFEIHFNYLQLRNHRNVTTQDLLPNEPRYLLSNCAKGAL